MQWGGQEVEAWLFSSREAGRTSKGEKQQKTSENTDSESHGKERVITGENRSGNYAFVFLTDSSEKLVDLPPLS